MVQRPSYQYLMTFIGVEEVINRASPATINVSMRQKTNEAGMNLSAANWNLFEKFHNISLLSLFLFVIFASLELVN